ncbi:DUF1963 domain-containing protein [Actibacterium lipolyticum]|uniref:DUF1963 domain-containing protein n=1 Tax=Actibacterium lipolyticum TaxID=1524263 RepID=A0A238KTQ7_9RHOB|nr:YwqG family protein [Actibacterium lipolyticum]SMX46087.1 hypothetical protein COL8621_02965 [Actibacterium lipolyticum]
MILDRYYQLAALIVAFLYFKEDAVFAVMMLIPLAFLALPVFAGLLVWQEWNGRVGAAGPRGLVRLRWELSRGPRVLAERRRKKIARALIKAYDLAPQAALPEQAARLERLMQDARAIDLRVPPILQKPLTAEGIAKFLAEAEGLSGPPRAALIAALVKATPKSQPRGRMAQARATIRQALAPLAGNALERRRISHVFFQVLIRGQASTNDRLASLAAAILDARKKAGLEGFAGKSIDPIIGLPLGVQRELVLISRIAFGNADMTRIALTDPSRVKRLRAIKDRMDTVSVPERHLWDVTTEPRAKAATTASPHTPVATSATSGPKQEPSEAELRTTLEDNAKEAILLARTWPISGDVPGRSWLGGAPLLPKSMAWPVLKASGAPLHFLAQIDCAELPRVKGGEAMPEDGLLLFFANISEEMLWEDEAGSAQVVYVPDPVIPDTPAALPARLADISGEPGRRSYPLWPVVPHATESFFWDYGMPQTMHNLAQSAQDAALAPFLPPPSHSKRNPLFQEIYLRDPETGVHLKDEAGNLKRQFLLNPELLEAGFPFCGAAMTRFVAENNAQIWQMIDSERSFKSYLERGFETTKDADHDRERIRKQDAKIAELSKSLAGLDKVSDRLTAFGDYDRVPDQEAQFFAEWLVQMKARAHPAIDTALRKALKSLAQQAVTDTKMQAVLPQALFDVFDAELCPSPAQSEHMMLGHTQIRTNSTAGPGLRLLALDSDSGLDFMFCDVGMAEFWIEPEDLAQRDFSKVVAFTAGG